MRRVTAAAAAWLLMLCVTTAPLLAQGPNLQVIPKLGAFSPLGSFTAETELEFGPAYGVAGELTLPLLPVNVRVSLDYAPATNVIRRDVAETVLGTVALTAIVAQVVGRPFQGELFQPFLLVGGGVKLYDVERGGGVGLTEIPDVSRRGTFHVGGGMDLSLGPVWVLVEVGNYMSTVPDAGESRLQHDAFGMIGFRVSMF